MAGRLSFTSRVIPSPTCTSVPLNRAKKTRNRSTPVETVFVVSIISGFPATAYREFNTEEPFPTFRLCRESPNPGPFALLDDSFLNRGREFRAEEVRQEFWHAVL